MGNSSTPNSIIMCTMYRYTYSKRKQGHLLKCFLMYTPFLKKRLYFEFSHRKKMWGSFLNNSISTQSFLKNWDSYILVSYKRVSYKKKNTCNVQMKSHGLVDFHFVRLEYELFVLKFQDKNNIEKSIILMLPNSRQ